MRKNLAGGRSKAWKAEMMKMQAAFDEFVSIKEHLLQQFLNGLPASLRSRLDLTPGSLDVLEQWLLEQYPVSPIANLRGASTSEAMVLASPEHDPSQNLNNAMLYVGEVVRRNFPGARWHVLVDVPRSNYFNVPLITSGSEPPFRFMVIPFTWVFSCLEKRSGEVFRIAYTLNFEQMQPM